MNPAAQPGTPQQPYVMACTVRSVCIFLASRSFFTASFSAYFFSARLMALYSRGS